MKNQGVMGKCEVCGKETTKKHLVANSIGVFDPDKGVMVWQKILGMSPVWLCSECVKDFGEKIVELNSEIERVLTSLEKEKDKSKRLN